MKKISLIITIALFVVSCANKKNILYLEGNDSFSGTHHNYVDYVIKVDDVLKIDIKFQSPNISTLNSTQNNVLSNAQNKETLIYQGHIVDSDGLVLVPMLGKIFAKGQTISQLRDIIYAKLVDSQILVDPFVDIKVLNLYFTVLGEVNTPGRYDYFENNINILEAIGRAGDLTITGKRNNIKLIREIDNKTTIHKLDLTNPELINSKFFQIQSGDIIIVDPNSTRVKNAGVIGNSGTLLSLLSFILSSIIVINN